MRQDLFCPACHHENLSFSWRVGAREAAQHFVLEGQYPERHKHLAARIKDLWKEDSCQIATCNSCGFGFAWPFVAGDAEFYNLAYPHVGYPSMKWDFTRTLRALASRETAGKSALEVGAGTGFFLDLVCKEELLLPSSLTAIEYNETALQALRSKGIVTMSDDIRSETFASKEGAFDFIFMFQVVEHMDRLDALFERIRYVLKPGGSVFLTVPNPVRTEFQETHGSLLDMPPNHIGRFTERAFFKLAKTAGLTVTSAEFEPFDALHFLKEDIVFSFSRRAQNPASLAHSLRKLPRGFFSKAVQAAGAALSAPSRLGAWRDAFANRSHMGASLWVQIDRP